MVDRAMTAGEIHPSCPGRIDPWMHELRVVVLAATLLLAGTGGAAAFPLLDATNEDQVTPGTELASPDVQDLQHQLRLANGLAAPAGGGWTFVPRVDWQEELTDNALEQHTPRQADLVTYISPGIGIAGDTPRVRLTFDFAPTLALYARTSELNSLTEQMNGLGTITLVPELAYIDVRAVSGVQSQFGGIGGLGSVGAPANVAAAPQTPLLAGNGEGLNRQNEVQTSSFGISPYLLRRFGDWGTAKVGYSLNIAESNPLSGFAASPIPVGGADAQTLVSNEEVVHFVTGDFMQYFQDSFDIDLQQGRATSATTTANTGTSALAQPAQNFSFTREIFTNQIAYQVNRAVSVFVSGGHEDIAYTAFAGPSVNDLTWSLGTTVKPGPDSSLTVSYGHLNGFNSLSVNGYYQATARTLLTVSYGSMLGTQLETVQNQLNLATVGANGGLVNAQTGGPLFGSTNALGVQNGVFRTTTLALGTQTTLDRDIILINLLMAQETNVGGINASTAQSKIASVSWLHQMRPDMTASAAISYAIQDQSPDISGANPGNNTSIAATLAWQWQISDTLSASVRYSFFERQSAVTAFEMYQNMLIAGISKRF
jgi:hypothetical protein